jgi:hypothetical protein
MSADTDYARIVEMLSGQHLTAYVAYDSNDSFSGMSNEKKHDHVVVRVHDGKIVSGSTHFKVSTTSGATSAAQDSNPVSRPLFDPKCYHATGERAASFEGSDALQITLAATCKDKHPGDNDYPFTTLFVDPHTMRPLDVNGTVPETDSNKGVSVSLDQRFENYNGYVMPSAIKVDVTGSGLMFWLQVHMTESYSNFQFLNSYSG